MGYGSLRGDTGDRPEPASELSANSEPPRYGLVLLRSNQGTTKSKPRPNRGMTKLRSHLQECRERRLIVARVNRLGLVRNWQYKRPQLLRCWISGHVVWWAGIFLRSKSLEVLKS